ncbi:hypothetical protein [Thermomonospora catenispora]|nr:hypothetical protein [Thermomonospora catenispora]
MSRPADGADDAVIVRSIVGSTRALGPRSVADGAEDARSSGGSA